MSILLGKTIEQLKWSRSATCGMISILIDKIKATWDKNKHQVTGEETGQLQARQFTLATKLEESAALSKAIWEQISDTGQETEDGKFSK